MVSSAIIGYVISFVTKLILGAWSDYQNRKALVNLGRTEAQRDQAVAGLEAQKEMGSIAATPADRAEILKRLEEGDA